MPSIKYTLGCQICVHISFLTEKSPCLVKPVGPRHLLYLIYTKGSFVELVSPPETNYQRINVLIFPYRPMVCIV